MSLKLEAYTHVGASTDLQVEAVKVTGDDTQSEEILEWIGEGLRAGAYTWANAWTYPDAITAPGRVPTTMAVVPGSWIVKDENNFLYVYSEDRFQNIFSKGWN